MFFGGLVAADPRDSGEWWPGALSYLGGFDPALLLLPPSYPHPDKEAGTHSDETRRSLLHR
jgi:hypothetical protein